MSKEIYISSTPHETRLAIVEDDALSEIYYERENEYTLAGSIYNGRVTRVLPGMQSSFVDIGLERDAFLYITDFMEEAGDSADFDAEGAQRGGATRSGKPGAGDAGGHGCARRAEPFGAWRPWRTRTAGSPGSWRQPGSPGERRSPRREAKSIRRRRVMLRRPWRLLRRAPRRAGLRVWEKERLAQMAAAGGAGVVDVVVDVAGSRAARRM